MKRGKSIIVGAIVALVTLVGYATIGALSTEAISATRDCDNGAIIYCGALTKSELQQKYSTNATHDLPAIYSHYGISSAMIQGGSAQSGYVTSTGNVVYNGKTVATGAYTAGRLGYPSSRIVTVGGTKLYEHSTQTSFRATSIPAYIWFDANGQFVAAILTSCGNPIVAHPVPVPPKPVYACTSLSADKLSRTQYSFATNASAKNGASITSYVYDFGDGVTASNGATVRHEYAKPGTYRATVTVKVSVDGKTVNAPGSCASTVTVAEAPCPIPGKTQYSQTDTRCIEDKPSVTIEKTVNNLERAIIAVNAPFNYQITVRNTGNIALKNAIVTDAAPTNVTFTASTVGTISNNAWQYTIADLGVGQSRQFSITATLTATQAGDIINKACVETPTVPGGNPDACDTATIDTPIQACDTSTNTVVTLNEDEFDASHMTKDLAQCEKIQVCKLDDKTQVTIARSQYNESIYSTDMSKCQIQTVAVVTPPELPHTGVGDAVGGSISIGSLAGATYYYGSSRRQLRKAMLKN